MNKGVYIITGGAGFIGSAFLSKLNAQGIDNILVVDELAEGDKWKNLNNKKFIDYLHKDEFLKRVLDNTLPEDVRAIFHLGANSSTTETRVDHLLQNNYRYSLHLAEYAVRNDTYFLYASSGATYGDGALGYSDSAESFARLSPLNGYGFSKHLFDLWVLRNQFEERVVGLKFFNVFGPNEWHKGDMRSVVHKAYQQVKSDGVIKLFKSYKPEVKDGEQKRDFIYVKDCCNAMWWLMEHPDVRGIFNLGSGKARSWNDLAKGVFASMRVPEKIQYIDMPEQLRAQYQYFTEADMSKLREAGYKEKFVSLEEGVKDYIEGYLERGRYL